MIELKDVNSITFISTESCNLACSYCPLANHINNAKHSKYTEEIRKSLLDGTYLNNINRICNQFHINHDKITKISLWGQESTLTMNEVAKAFPDIYKCFPNINLVFFSTNGVDYSERIVDFAKVIQNTITHRCTLDFQFSYDGFDATKNLRGADPETIINNIKKTILGLNELNLTTLRVHIAFHNVISDGIFNTYANEETDNEMFIKFLTEFNNLSDEFYNLNTNPNVDIEKHFSPGLITPYNATVEEGKNLVKFLKRANALKLEIFPWWDGIIKQGIRRVQNSNSKEAKNYIRELSNKTCSQKNTLKFLSSHCSCGFSIYDLKVRYDGTLMYCQNAITAVNKDEYNTKDDFTSVIFKELNNNYSFFPNPLTDSDYTYTYNHLDLAYTAQMAAFPYYFAETLNLMYLLLACGQIDSSYKNDEEKLLRHAYLMAVTFPCWDNNIRETGSGFGRTMGAIRLHCNGFLDLIEEAVVNNK